MKKNILCKIFCVVMSLCMVVPNVNYTAFAQEVQEENANQENQTEEATTEDAILGDYYNQYATELLEKGMLSVDNENISMEANEKSDSVIISGANADILGATFKVDKTFNFDGGIVSRFSFDGLTVRGTKATLAFYLDDEIDPFATISLYRQKKKGDWKYSKDFSIDISDRKLTGEHTVSFKVLSASADTVSISLKSFEFVESSVPVIYFDIDEEDGTISEMNNSEDHSAECSGNMTIKVPEGYVSEYTSKELSSETYTMEYIRGRGNSTWWADKKPYKIKLDQKADLLGMGKNKHWVLLANYYDNSLLRNKITYWLGQELGMKFTPKSVPVDVVMNGEYYGSYFLCEQIRVGKTRVNIDDLEDEDVMDSTDEPTITGGYLLSLFPYNYKDENVTFTTKNDVEFTIESPEFEDREVNEAQVNYITNYVQSVEDAIYGKDFCLEDGTSYKDLMDVTSAVYYYWMQEFSMNGDGFISGSTYLYKERNGKLFWGPLWDFDYVAWGSTEYDGLQTEGWCHTNSMWFARLFKDETFANAVKETWPIIREKMVELVKEGGQLDKYKEQMEITARYNFEKWGMSDIGFWWDDYYGESEESPATQLTYDEEIERLREWINLRIDWVDENVDSLEPREATLKFVVDGQEYATRTVSAGDCLTDMPQSPEKEGYVFIGWEKSLEYTYEELLDALGLTQSQVEEFFGPGEFEEFINEYFSGEFNAEDEIYLNMTLTAKFVEESKVVAPKSIELSREQVRCSLWDDGFQLKASVIPFDTTVSSVHWSSSNPEVAYVDSYGYVEVYKAGMAVITAKTSNGISKTCKVIVYDDDEEMSYEEEAQFSKSKYEVKVGDYKKLPIYYSPSPALMNLSFEFISSDSSVAEVDEVGVIHAVAPGTATIVAYTYGTVMTTNIVVLGEEVPEVIIKDDKDTVDNTKNITKQEAVTKFTVDKINYAVVSDGKVAVMGADKNIKTLKIPKTVKYQNKTYKVTNINAKAFYGYKKLKKVSIASGVQFIGTKAFANCKNLSSVTIGSGVQVIYSKAFYNDKKLKSIKLNADNAKINKKAFGNINKKAKIKVKKKNYKYYKLVLKGKKIVK